jgi:hypothetical protein
VSRNALLTHSTDQGASSDEAPQAKCFARRRDHCARRCNVRTAFAATLITTSQIKDGTILPRDLSVKARNYLKGQSGPQGATGTTGATGPQGPGGLPQLGTFTPTQVVDGAILTCASSTATTCNTPQLNGLGIASSVAGATEICAFVRGTATRFMWDGSKWVTTTGSDQSYSGLLCS